jgi:dolichol-phosphate mannosyltransferase
MDGDLQHDPSDIPKMIKIFFDKKIDILIGARNFKKKIKGLSYIRFYISKLLIIFLNLFLITKTNDPLSGFFIFKKNIYMKNKKNYFGKGYKILIDILYNTHDTIRIYDHKINFRLRNAESSKMNYKIALLFIKFIILCFLKKFKKIF